MTSMYLYHKKSFDTLNTLVTRKYRFSWVTQPNLSGVPLTFSSVCIDIKLTYTWGLHASPT